MLPAASLLNSVSVELIYEGVKFGLTVSPLSALSRPLHTNNQRPEVIDSNKVLNQETLISLPLHYVFLEIM